MLYPRLVEIRREKSEASSSTTVGLVGYSGAEIDPYPANQSGEEVLYTKIPANIQAGSARARRGTGPLPQDAVTNPQWDIYIPITALALGAVQARDIVVDDLGVRYQVGQPYCNLLGWKLRCIALEA